MFGRKLLRCFCGKDETQVSKLVAGPGIFICVRCAATAARIIDGSSGNAPPAPRTSISPFVLTRAWRWLCRQTPHRMDEIGEGA